MSVFISFHSLTVSLFHKNNQVCKWTRECLFLDTLCLTPARKQRLPWWPLIHLSAAMLACESFPGRRVWGKKEEEDGRIREGEDMRTSKNVWKQNPIFDNFYGDRMTRARPKPSQNTHSTDLIGWSNYFEMCLFFQLITITAYVMA